MEKPDDIGVAVTYNPEKERFLILKRAEDQDGSFPGCWESQRPQEEAVLAEIYGNLRFPGGYMEGNEDSEDTALRELREETGLIGTPIRNGEAFEVKTDKNYYRINPVLVIVEDDNVNMTEEHTDYKWATVKETEELETVGKFRQDLVAVGVLDE